MRSDLVSLLSEQSGFSISDVLQIISSAPRRYKVFEIPKRNGRGSREIAQPSRELKDLQRILIRHVLHRLPVHPAAHGYVPGKGIRTNALHHKSSEYILKTDLTNFFPSLVPGDLRAHIRKFLPDRFEKIELEYICRVIFWKPKGQSGLRLCIGAPSSPFVSNTLMYEIDSSISELCVKNSVLYTRYADDMTFSCLERGVLSRIFTGVCEILAASKHPSVVLNESKTVHSSRAHLRSVTGVVISSQGNLSLGRDRKRLIRAMVHRSALGVLNEADEKTLNGLLSFANDIEPDFRRKMLLRRSMRPILLNGQD